MAKTEAQQKRGDCKDMLSEILDKYIPHMKGIDHYDKKGKEVLKHFPSWCDRCKMDAEIEISEVRELVLKTFKEFGGWWPVDKMAAWIQADIDVVRMVYSVLQRENLIDRK